MTIGTRGECIYCPHKVSLTELRQPETFHRTADYECVEGHRFRETVKDGSQTFNKLPTRLPSPAAARDEMAHREAQGV